MAEKEGKGRAGQTETGGVRKSEEGGASYAGAGVGQRIRRFRELSGLSQAELGEKLGVSYQQIQKYERGVNRVTVETLVRLGRILGQPVVALLDPGETSAPRGSVIAETRTAYAAALSKDEKELLRAYRELGDDKLKSACLLLMKSAGRKHGKGDSGRFY